MESDHAHERRAAGHLDRPKAPPLTRMLLSDAVHEGVALGPAGRRAQRLHHQRMRVQIEERLPVRVLERSQHESRGREDRRTLTPRRPPARPQGYASLSAVSAAHR